MGRCLHDFPVQLVLQLCQGLQPCLCIRVLRLEKTVQGCLIILQVSASMTDMFTHSTAQLKRGHCSMHMLPASDVWTTCLYGSCQRLPCRIVSVCLASARGGEHAFPEFFPMASVQNVLQHGLPSSCLECNPSSAFRAALIQYRAHPFHSIPEHASRCCLCWDA